MFRYVSIVLLVPLVAAAGGALRHTQARNLFEETPLDELERDLQSGPSPKAGGMVVVKSTNGFDGTYNSLINAITASPASIVAEVDHAAGAASVGLDLLPNRLVVVANPVLGTPIMEENLLAGLDLPQKFLVWEDEDGDVFVGYNQAPEYLENRFMNVENAETQLMTMQGALSNFASVATGVEQDTILNTLQPNRPFPPNPNQSGLFVVKSNGDFTTSRDRLLDALNADGGPSIAFEVDHAANAPNGELNPNFLVVFGNPNVGTPLIQQSATTGIDLPLKILISEADDGTAYVSSNMIGYLCFRHGLAPIQDDLTTIRGALLNFMGIAADKDFSMYV